MLKKIGLILAIFITVFISYNLLSQILEALKSGERLSTEADSLYKLEAKNKELKKRLEEVKSTQFIEKEARNKLGLSKPGETIIVIPDEKIKEILQGSASAQETRLPNPLGWWKLFFK